MTTEIFRRSKGGKDQSTQILYVARNMRNQDLLQAFQKIKLNKNSWDDWQLVQTHVSYWRRRNDEGKSAWFLHQFRKKDNLFKCVNDFEYTPINSWSWIHRSGGANRICKILVTSNSETKPFGKTRLVLIWEELLDLTSDLATFVWGD